MAIPYFGVTPAADLVLALNTLISYLNGGTYGTAGLNGGQVSPRTVNTGGAPAMAAADGTDATPVSTEVYFAEILVPCNMLVTGVANFNGSVASGNLKAGLFSATGAVLATSASTSMVGTDDYQLIPFTATLNVLGPARYYIGIFVDNNTARINEWPVGKFGANKQTGQTFATGFTAITPPTTFVGTAPIAGLY